MTYVQPLLSVSSARSDVSLLDVKDKTNGGSARATSLDDSEPSCASTAAVFETLRVLYLCTFLSFALNLVLVLYFAFCCLLVIGVTLLHSGTVLLLLDVVSPASYSG